MHELPISESILNIAQKHAALANATKVTDIHIVIGKLSSVIDDSVQFYWDFVSQDTICSGAKLHFERIPAKFTCLKCNFTYTLDGDLTPCPNCGSAQIKIISGEEFWVDSIEIEKQEP
jgi:hydrogenase nickel incorporation protein HypA/HybF